MGWRSGDWLGHSRTLMCFFLSHSFVALAVCFGSLLRWNTHPRPIFNALALMLHVRCSWWSFLLLQTRRVDLMPKHWILVSSDHNTFTQFSSESLINFRRVCSCAFLIRGILRSPQDFSPSWRNVTNCFLGDYGLSCLEVIDKILSCSSGLIPHRSHDHWNSTRWDLAFSPRPRKIDSYFVFLPFVNNRTNCCLEPEILLIDIIKYQILISLIKMQLLPGRCSINGCPLLRVCVQGVCVFTAVCAHFGWVKCRAQIPSMGHHTWLYVMSLSLSNKPTTKIIDWSFLCQWANIQNQQGIKYPPHTHTLYTV